MANEPTGEASKLASILAALQAGAAEIFPSLGTQLLQTELGDPPEDVKRVLWYHRLCQVGVITTAEFARLKRIELEAPKPAPTTPAERGGEADRKDRS